MKNNSFFSQGSYFENSLPNIDRSSKAAAVRTYETPKEFSQILEEQESIVEKSLENQRELLKVELDLKKNELNETKNDPENEYKLLADRQLLEYKCMELETWKSDFVSKMQNSPVSIFLSLYVSSNQLVFEFLLVPRSQ